jgi:homocysteine S-methyltransferase
LPIVAGILPLYGPRHAAFLHNEVPGIDIPDPIQKRIIDAGDDSPKEGVVVASELLLRIRQLAQGAYIMPAFGRYDLAAGVVDALGRSKTTRM